jgi:uncharacterized protein YgiM (DUF1202 family)
MSPQWLVIKALSNLVSLLLSAGCRLLNYLEGKAKKKKSPRRWRREASQKV